MSCQNHQDFCVAKGATFEATLRWATNILISKAITAINRAAPAVVTAVGHGLPANWPAAVVSAGGMTQINSPRFPPRLSDMSPISVLSVDTVALVDVSSADYSAYTSGGYLVAYTPGDLGSITAASLRVYDNASFTGTPLVTLGIGTGITLNNTTKTIFATFESAALDWEVGYYQLMLTDNTSRIIPLSDGVITIET